MTPNTESNTVSDATLQFYLNPTPPHSRLPNELLAEIFMLFTPNPIKISWAFRDHDLPWALLRVCKKWRSLVLGMPDLWSNIYVDYASNLSWEDPAIGPLRMTVIAHKVLLRSRDTFLSLQIRSNTYDMKSLGPLTDLIILHSHRLKSLELNVLKKSFRKCSQWRQFLSNSLNSYPSTPMIMNGMASRSYFSRTHLAFVAFISI